MGGRTGDGRAQAAGADEQRAQTDCERGYGRHGQRRASQNRDVTPWAWLRGADGRALDLATLYGD